MPQQRSSAPILTPCVGVCALEPQSGLCLGCGRSVEEIGAWARLSDPARRAIMDQLPARLARLTGEPSDASAVKGSDGTDALR